MIIEVRERAPEERKEIRKGEAPRLHQEVQEFPDSNTRSRATPASCRKGICFMFGLVPFVSRKDLAKEENAFDCLFDVFDEPFLTNFKAPDFKVDVKDNGTSYELTAELPGLKKEDISLTYEDHYLTIATKTAEDNDKKDEKGNYVRRERRSTSMSRSFYIDNIDESKATAEYKDGVLTVCMPKLTEKAEPSHTISIEG